MLPTRNCKVLVKELSLKDLFSASSQVKSIHLGAAFKSDVFCDLDIQGVCSKKPNNQSDSPDSDDERPLNYPTSTGGPCVQTLRFSSKELEKRKKQLQKINWTRIIL